jgi:chromosome segregation protein
MLKALELHGFKSFCDKTRFEFPAGITVVVGPNGSGKSNIVDAIKWVLGEQSAKSLRGAAMADVIFKGTSKRRPASSAEATIIFDNSDRRFEFDADEVLVTRRAYRSGEGEYLINGQACRLRDIKDMFRGTGVGTDAYSLIEQGKVDSLLQASAKDRRAIFEEAAGISRFKAKKVEAQRRLERVDQNLLRLSDIVDEVDSRLRRLKSQASKARRYKEHSDRLQSLRTQVGRVDWQELSSKLITLDGLLTSLFVEKGASTEELEAEQQRLNAIDAELEQVELDLRSIEARASQNREQLAAGESLIGRERETLVELDEQLDRQRSQMLGLSGRAGDLKTQLDDALAQLQAAESDHGAKTESLAKYRTSLDEATAALNEAKVTAEAKRNDYVTNVRSAADLGNQIIAQQSLLEANQARTDKAEEELARFEAQLATANAKRDKLAQQHQEAADELASAAADLEAKEAEVLKQRQRQEQLRQEQAEWSRRNAAAVERMKVLEEIEQRMEGIESGVKEILERAAAEVPGPFAGVRGMVADLLQATDVKMAEMLEVALGVRAQDLVVAGSQLFEALEAEEATFRGRVGFMRLHSSPPVRLGPPVDLSGQSGVIGRAEDFVSTGPEYQHLVQWLLRDTWFVETLTDAMQYSRSVSSPLRFVTGDGQFVDRDGRLVVGKVKTAIGLLSRRTELRELGTKVASLQAEIQQRDGELAQQEQAAKASEEVGQRLAADQEQRKQAEAESRLKLASAEERVAEFAQQLETARNEQQQAAGDVAGMLTQLTSQRESLSVVEALVKTLETAVATHRTELSALESSVDVAQQATTEWQVAVAKSEQRLEALRSQCDQLQRDQSERRQALEAAAEQTERLFARQASSELRILNATAELSERYLANESFLVEGTAQLTQASDLRRQRTEVNGSLDQTRERLRSIEQQAHAHEMSAEKLRHERGVLADRLEEDYGITTHLLEQAPSADELAERAEVDAEISELRRKITNLGAVNMDALDELNELESRHTTLGDQYRDLVEAKENLERIIQKINADSRRLFSETLDAIRGSFQVLFRKLFGGGTADIVLEEDVDILESGIDILATPPGKQSLSLSLLSGGERALTAVALLMAIFEYRPSPFCVLDEVDGPLDEANIGRFVGTLQDFLKWTKFVVVTHSKRTMTCANTLYGVTMQESGISKRVSVRFEDVNEHGEISDDAVAREESGNAGAA